jgi:small-conductance mechanosensitive channel
MIRGSSIRLGMEYSEALGTIVNIGVLIITFVIALTQLKIDATMLGNILLLVIGAFAIGLAIALGLGAKDFVKNIISGVYVGETVKPGSTVRIKDMMGKLVDIGPDISTIEVNNKEIKVNNSSFMENL